MIYILVGAIVIGLTLGMLGSGGSAITVPVLIYLVGHSTKIAIAESMAIVGLISIAAAIPYGLNRQLHWRSVFYFGLPGMAGTFLGAWLGGKANPAIQLIAFGAVLLLASYFMLRKPKHVVVDDSEEVTFKPAIWKVATEGTIVGIVTGFVGVGGGFLIVPALALLARLPMRLAIGTSLVVIAAKSAVGFAKYQVDLSAHGMSVDWQTIAIFSVLGILGSFIGRAINKRLNQQKLKLIFAIFLIVLGMFVIARESQKLFAQPTPEVDPIATDLEDATNVQPAITGAPAVTESPKTDVSPDEVEDGSGVDHPMN